jgi:NAD(P)-dependent dehydrogenase (short-subunit alcohol dehydrogenase family)
MRRLEGTVALVTGAGAGMGEEICYRFVREGGRVVAMDVNPANAERVAAAACKLAEGKPVAHGVGGDVRKLEECRKAVEFIQKTFGVPHILCNIAGVVEMGPLVEANDASWDRSMDINVRGIWNLCRLVVPLMAAQKRGSVINMASVAGPFAVKDRGVYSVSKAAVIGLTKSLAMDHIGQGIRVNAICPGTVETPSWHDRVNQAADPQQALKEFIARQPMGRVGRADEVAALAAYLACDESAYMTGQALYIDGGMTM